MKLINNILQIIVATGLLFSCTNEALIEGPVDLNVPPVTGEKTTTDLRFAIGDDIVSRALSTSHENMTAEAKEYFEGLMAQEKTVNRLFVAAFVVTDVDGEGNIAEGTLIDNSAGIYPFSKEEGSEYYEVKGIPIVTGDIGFLVIANSETMETPGNYEKLEKFSEFKKFLIEETEVANSNRVFDPSNLVKVGEEIVKKEDIDCNNCIVNVDLFQLAARVDVLLQNLVKPIKEEVPVFGSYGMEYADLSKIQKNDVGSKPLLDASGKQIEINGVPQYFTYDASAGLSILKVLGLTSGNGLVGYDYFIDGDRYTINESMVGSVTNGTKGARLDNLLLEGTFVSYEWEISIPKVKLYNIESKSYILEGESMLSDPTSGLLVHTEIVPEPIGNNDFVFSFYSYEKPYYDDYAAEGSEVLNVYFDAEWVEMKKTIKNVYQVAGGGALVQKE